MRTKRESGKIIMWLRKIMVEGSVNGNERIVINVVIIMAMMVKIKIR
jgi:hypothetical protein